MRTYELAPKRSRTRERHHVELDPFDEIVIHLAPVLLGDGVRLYESIGADPIVLAAYGRRNDRPAD
jgi:hypothetical protein